MKRSEQILRQHKVKVTPQRLAVYGVFNNGSCHLSAEEIFQKVKAQVPAISLGTIYAILENFTSKHLLNEIKIDFSRSLYERTDEDHHHFLCRLCQKVLDVEMPRCSALDRKSVQGHAIENFQGYFYGVCKDCSSRKDKA